VQLAADAGRMDVVGTVDAAGASGGSVSLWARDGLALAAGSRVDAHGTGTATSDSAPLSDGGRVQMATTGGVLNFDAASTIDVSPGAKGRAGSVTFGVSRDAANRVAETHLAGTVLGRDSNGSASVVLEATRRYDVVSAPAITSLAADHAAFIAATDAAALLGGLKADGGAAANTSLRGATEVRTSGDLALKQAWDLTTTQWLAGGRPGTLTLRAAGDLTLSSALGMPNDNLVAGATWNLRLVGGADLAAANPLATLPVDGGTGKGNVVLSGNSARVRTGTGSIDIAAATDFVMTAPLAVVYTAGQIGAQDKLTGGNNRWAKNGGSITVHAGRDAVGASDQWITDWMRRTQSTLNTAAAEWWVYRPNFQQGLGTLGGGDISLVSQAANIDAGRGAKTSVTTPPPVRRALTDAQGNFIGFEYTLPVAVAGSGIQTVTSKPGGPSSVAPPAGSIFLFAPAGTIDAGEAGINSGAGIFLAALTVLNADNISSVGPSVGVPPVVTGSVAASLASSGTTTAAGSSKDSEAATQAAASAAKAAAATAFKPAILTVEVMGFGDKNCKETDRDCFAK